MGTHLLGGMWDLKEQVWMLQGCSSRRGGAWREGVERLPGDLEVLLSHGSQTAHHAFPLFPL